MAARHSPCGFLPPAPFCSLLTEGCFYDYFRISLRQWTNWVLGPTLAVKGAFLAVDLSGSIERKTAVAATHCAGFAGYSRRQCLNWLLLPSVASALAMAMLAIVAWSLSVVDVAIILGQVIPDAGGN